MSQKQLLMSFNERQTIKEERLERGHQSLVWRPFCIFQTQSFFVHSMKILHVAKNHEEAMKASEQFQTFFILKIKLKLQFLAKRDN